MLAPTVRGAAALKLLDDTIAASSELELFRDIFQATYGLTGYKEHYERFFESRGPDGEPEHVLDPSVAAYCQGVIAKHAPRS